MSISKVLTVVLSVVLSSGLILQTLAAAPKPVETFVRPAIVGIAPIKSSFSPLENPEFEVIATLPDSCFSLFGVESRVDRDYNVVMFYVRTARNTQPCTGRPIEARAEFSLKPLREGTYEIRELRSLKNWGRLSIESAPHLRVLEWTSQELAQK